MNDGYTLIAGVQMGFYLHPCHVANAGVGSAHGVSKTLEGRAVGDKCAVGTHFDGVVLRLGTYKKMRHFWGRIRTNAAFPYT